MDNHYETIGVEGRVYSRNLPMNLNNRAKAWFVSDFIGQILPQDVGRRVFDKGDYLAAEDNKHMKERLGK